MVEIIVDEENPASAFWQHVANNPNAPDELRTIEIGDRIPVTAARADEIRKWCMDAPGFYGGPRYAPVALIFQPEEE